MTRKISLFIILILLIFGCYAVAFGEYETIRKDIASIEELKKSSDTLKASVETLEKNSTVDFEDKKEKLAKTIEEYNKAKEEYETILPQAGIDVSEIALEESLKDMYDVDFLWTIVGNYATEEGIDLKFDINKNYNSASSINNTSDSYVVCDLKFVITGNYINLTDFIYDLEDDDRLNFEINDFEMQKNGDSLQVTFIVEEIKLNSTNLIETNSSIVSTNTTIQEIEADTSMNTTNTSATNTTNTVSNSVN